jgi:hypothetical protein
VTLVFAMAVYSLYYLHRVEKEIDKRTPTPVPSFKREERIEVDTIRNVPTTRSYSLAFTTESRNSNVGHDQPD